jgi:hypothetical protein
LQAGQAGGDESLAPLADGVPVAVEFRSDLPIVGLIFVGGTQDQATAKDESLGCGARPEKGVELGTQFGGKDDAGSERTWHERPPGNAAEANAAGMLIL